MVLQYTPMINLQDNSLLIKEWLIMLPNPAISPRMNIRRRLTPSNPPLIVAPDIAYPLPLLDSCLYLLPLTQRVLTLRRVTVHIILLLSRYILYKTRRPQASMLTSLLSHLALLSHVSHFLSRNRFIISRITRQHPYHNPIPLRQQQHNHIRVICQHHPLLMTLAFRSPQAPHFPPV